MPTRESDSHDLILKSLGILSTKVDSGFKDTNDSIVALKVAQAVVATRMEGANSRIKTLESKVDTIRIDDSKVVDLPPVLPPVRSVGLTMKDLRWLIPLILTLLAMAGFVIPAVGYGDSVKHSNSEASK